jgi:DNA-binding MarR family transcriptional regulator
MPEQDSSMQLVHLLRGLTVELDLAAARFARLHQLNGSDLRALIALLDAERGGTAATPGWLTTQLQLSSASTTALVDRLVTRGLVQRQSDPNDRRRTLLLVTDDARELGGSFFGPLITRVTTTLDSGFDTAERAVLQRALQALTTAVRHAPR